jgi:Uri superfamily endonuclease
LERLDRFASPGTYALLLALPRRQTLQVGRLGRAKFKHGIYVYIGSAFGPGGLNVRISHHLRVSLKPRWHIDYLRGAAYPTAVWYTYDPVHREHQWAKIFMQMTRATITVDGFGSSDCDCQSHLFFFAKLPFIRNFRKHVYSRIPDHSRIFSKTFHR